MKLLSWTCVCVLLVAIAGCKPDSAVKRGAVIDAAPSHSDSGKAGQAAPGTPQQNQTPPKKVQ
ncbi:MAG TPA: hypothetical protein VIM67_06910 [Terriglobus sp.]